MRLVQALAAAQPNGIAIGGGVCLAGFIICLIGVGIAQTKRFQKIGSKITLIGLTNMTLGVFGGILLQGLGVHL